MDFRFSSSSSSENPDFSLDFESLQEQAAIPPFLTKIFDMVDDVGVDSTVSWSSNGTSFVVWDPIEFARTILPRYFKHSNFSSFVRQLNTYGFRKVDPDRWEFANDGFVQGKKYLLKSIPRRKSSQVQYVGRTVESCVEVGKFGLEDEIERLRRDKQILMIELVRLRHQQHITDHKIIAMNQQLQVAEQRQQQMMSFMAKAMQSPVFVSQLNQQVEREHVTSGRRKRRSLKLPQVGKVSSGTSSEGKVSSGTSSDGQVSSGTSSEGQIVRYYPRSDVAASSMGFQNLERGGGTHTSKLGDSSHDMFGEFGGLIKPQGLLEKDAEDKYGFSTVIEQEFGAAFDPVATGLSDNSSVCSSRILSKGKDIAVSHLDATKGGFENTVYIPQNTSEEGSILPPDFSSKQRDNLSFTLGSGDTCPDLNDPFWENFFSHACQEFDAAGEAICLSDAGTQREGGGFGVSNWLDEESSVDDLANQMKHLADDLL